MRLFSKVGRVHAIILVIVAGVLSGCGGSGGSGVPDTGTFVEASADISTSGGSVTADGITATFPADAGRTTGSVLLRIRSKPFVTTTASDLFPKGIQIVAKPSQLGSQGLTLTIPIPSVAGTVSEEWHVAFGDNSSKWASDFVTARRVSPSTVEVAVTAAQFSNYSNIWTGKGRDNDTDRNLSISVATARASQQGAVRLLKAALNGPDVVVGLDAADTLAGKRTAIIIHGLNNSAEDMLDLAEDAFNTGAYDQLWFVDYHDTTAGIAASAKDMSDLLKARAPATAKRIDIYGHSMGGLVARWAIEQEGLGQNVQRLFTFGTPHKGVPGTALASLVYMLGLTGKGVRDLDASGDFITHLNASPSIYVGNIMYGAFAGYNDSYFGFVGSRMHDIYTILGYVEWIDGVVRIGSAIPDNLGLFGKCDIGNPQIKLQGRTTGIFNFNHSDIGGSSKDSSVQRAISARLKEMVDASVGAGGG